MSAIAGIWATGNSAATSDKCAELLRAQERFGSIDLSVAKLGPVALGRSLHPSLFQDTPDAQPVTGGDGRFLLVADIRIDNREDLRRALNLSAPERDVTDAKLLMKAWERWGVHTLARLSADFALAVWDEEKQSLTLARDVIGQRPLHYAQTNGTIVFASMPRALFVLPEIKARLDEHQLARLVADLAPPNDETYYRGVKRVPPGHYVLISRDQTVTRRYWEPPLRQLRLPSDDDYVEAFRERVNHAVRARLRGAGPTVATHLSAGYDSGTVTATAATLMGERGGKVLAYTSAPRAGYCGEVPRGRIADEVPYAALTANRHANIEHVVIRSDGTSQFDLLDEQHGLVQYPLGQLSNNLWWTAINRSARERGATVLLTGQVGNLGMSAGNLSSLADFIREGRLLHWWRESRLLVARGPARWRGVLANSFGPWMPRCVWRTINSRFAGSSPHVQTPHLLNPAWAGRIDNRINPGRDTMPPRDSYALRVLLLGSIDPGSHRKGRLAAFGIDERDPTADRELLEFCLSLPPDQLLKNGVARPLARRALADRLPDSILNDGPRGYQMADWHEALSLDRVREEVERLAATPLATEIIDLARLRQMVEDWPTGDWNSPRIVLEYRFWFLMALSLGHFIRSFEAERQLCR